MVKTRVAQGEQAIWLQSLPTNLVSLLILWNSKKNYGMSLKFFFQVECKLVGFYWLFYVTVNDISVIYVQVHVDDCMYSRSWHEY